MPSTVTVTVEQGGAGFAANEDLSGKKVDPEGRCDEAGVEVGMFVIEFQERPLEPGTTWATLCGSRAGIAVATGPAKDHLCRFVQ